ncbi:MAG: hypothetical protein HWQ43_31190 [Nostoc sp. JL31]|uniref:hypothetical protein n=1 Tax=Nostoc sp. JL31 TaxID=2815395 RepID=UPI0025E85CB2|nr:hypothetical protein [Nostoc sp. JL31]MBN3893388.1 hypothetical protein [Nostoc sp. JL31]
MKTGYQKQAIFDNFICGCVGGGDRYEIITPVSLTLYEKSLRCQAFLEICGRVIALL